MNRPDPSLEGPAELDPELLGRIEDDFGADAPDAELASRVKRRVLRRIAQDQLPRHLTVQPGDSGWQPFGHGLTIKLLNENAGVASYLVRMAPGSSLAPHRHPMDEECVVLEGSLVIGDLVVLTGGFHMAHKDDLHDRVHTVDGALIFLRGASPVGEMVI
jgi:anti-sigma factor ChrR (cupin superfamily)